MGELTKTLPGSWYCSKQLHDLERRAVFLKVDVLHKGLPSQGLTAGGSHGTF
jgi:hypothetical protein